MGTITENEPTNGTSNLEAKTNGELTAEVVELKRQLNELNVRLWGDEKKRALWAENKRTYVTPNISEPPLGLIPKLVDNVFQIEQNAAHAHRGLTARIDQLDKHMSFVDRVSAWIGPLMDSSEFQPPLGGMMIASKHYVDNAVALLSGALRAEWNEAKHLTQTFVKTFRDSTLVDEPQDSGPGSKAKYRLAIIDDAIERLSAMVDWAMRKDEEDRAPRGFDRLRLAARFMMGGDELPTTRRRRRGR